MSYTSILASHTPSKWNLHFHEDKARLKRNLHTCNCENISFSPQHKLVSHAPNLEDEYFLFSHHTRSLKIRTRVFLYDLLCLLLKSNKLKNLKSSLSLAIHIFY